MPAASASPVALPHPHPHPNKRFHTSPAATATTGRFPSSLMAVMNLDDGGADGALSSDDDDDTDFEDDVPVGPAQEACRAAVAPAPAAAHAVAPISHGAPTSLALASSAVLAAAVGSSSSCSPPLPSASVPVSASQPPPPLMPMRSMPPPPTTGMTPAANGATPTHHAARHLHCQHHPTAPLGHHQQHQIQHQHQHQQHQHAPLAHPFHVATLTAQACTPPPVTQAPTQPLQLPWPPAGPHAQPVAPHHALPQEQQQHLQYAPAHQQQQYPQDAHAQHYQAHTHHSYLAVSAPAPAPIVPSTYPHQDASMSSYYRENPYRATPPAPLHHAAPPLLSRAAAAAGTPESDILDRITWMPTGMPLVARAAGAPAILAALLTDGKAFRCIPCGQRFRRKADTVRHVRSLHTAEKPHICPACHRGFARVDALKRHLDTDPECAAKGIVRENARCNAVPVLSGASRRRASVPAGVALARGDEAMVAALIGAAKLAGAGEAAVAPVSAE
ncbi:hypothetical protein AMAG_05981 [Allomyces macrogynus ATCC 38327]|uniref:C2H2-type domain-containing protein n=1 Tax=Allomyces macrogynus (strain ATCC 38327) TaxID=578462 RepID=A0A0L0SDN9_ALLM3|nr:hypothetical protein AMAG_05981 [Allomyces macrogynus ATCC 38327]|eukprot:KNE60601.1 hypothetical protein AMAG_05981 [Allomyces macrogynus ATCC 38327]